MAAAKFAVGIAIGSLALISEALHSSVDVVATVITWLVVRVSDQPADEEHHYGHGKFESLSALFVIALLYVLAGGILVESWSRLREGAAAADALGDPLRGAGDRYRGEFLAGAGAASHGARDQKPGAGGRRAAFRLRRARLHRRHHRAGADRPRLCLGRLGRRHRGRRDDIDPGPAARPLHHRDAARSRAGGRSEKAIAAIRSVPGVVGVERLRVRMVGPTHFIDAIVKVPRTYPIDRVEAIKKTAQAAVAQALGDADLTFTAVPVARDNESVRERIMVIARNSGLAIHHVTVHDLGEKLIVGIDLEVDGDMELAAAHEVTRVLERNIREDFGEDVEVDTHIEPLEPELPHGTDAAPERVEAIKAALTRFAGNGAIHDIHNVRVRDTDAGEVVNFHCRAAPSMSVIKVHENVDEIERALRRAFPTIKRVISHAEPPRA